MRNPSIFRSTKSFVAKTVEASNEVLDLGIKELQATKALNAEENSIELMEARVNTVTTKAQLTASGYAQLAEIDKLPIPDEVKATLKAQLLEALSL